MTIILLNRPAAIALSISFD